MNLSDFANISTIMTFIIGAISGFSVCKVMDKSKNSPNMRNIKAGGDVIGRDKISRP